MIRVSSLWVKALFCVSRFSCYFEQSITAPLKNQLTLGYFVNPFLPHNLGLIKLGSHGKLKVSASDDDKKYGLHYH